MATTHFRSPHFQIATKLKECKKTLSVWNYHTFGKIQDHLSKLKEEISDLQMGNNNPQNIRTLQSQ
uniref:Uncharacterized protein n=1 Tax=Nelumbo nucifera TaxID=4432 RepID=A0A822XGN8_NELNU|nr:TPA_asm: hypothetical protein HUJ06_020850 [Nelumbo nucifera]